MNDLYSILTRRWQVAERADSDIAWRNVGDFIDGIAIGFRLVADEDFRSDIDPVIDDLGLLFQIAYARADECFAAANAPFHPEPYAEPAPLPNHTLALDNPYADHPIHDSADDPISQAA